MFDKKPGILVKKRMALALDSWCAGWPPNLKGGSLPRPKTRWQGDSRLPRFFSMGWLIGIVLLAASPVLLAQSQKSIEGTVEGPLGAVVQDVRVTLETEAGQKTAETTTNENGHFQFTGLASVHYILLASAPGLAAGPVSVTAGEASAVPLHIRLALLTSKQEVTVTSSAGPGTAVSAQRNHGSLKLDQNEIQSLPTEGDDPLAVPMLFIEPAAEGAQGPEIIVDGVPSSSLDVPMSSIQSVTVAQDPYSAEYERPGSGRIEVTTRQGSRHHYRGLLALQYRNSALDARNAFAAVTPPLHRTASGRSSAGRWRST